MKHEAIEVTTNVDRIDSRFFLAAAAVLTTFIATFPAVAQSQAQTQKGQLYQYKGEKIPPSGYPITQVADVPGAPNFLTCDNRRIRVDVNKLEPVPGNCTLQLAPGVGGPWVGGPWVGYVAYKTPEGNVSFTTKTGEKVYFKSADWKKLIANSKDVLAADKLPVGEWLAFSKPSDSALTKIYRLAPNKQ